MNIGIKNKEVFTEIDVLKTFITYIFFKVWIHVYATIAFCEILQQRQGHHYQYVMLE